MIPEMEAYCNKDIGNPVWSRLNLEKKKKKGLNLGKKKKRTEFSFG